MTAGNLKGISLSRSGREQRHSAKTTKPEFGSALWYLACEFAGDTEALLHATICCSWTNCERGAVNTTQDSLPTLSDPLVQENQEEIPVGAHLRSVSPAGLHGLETEGGHQAAVKDLAGDAGSGPHHLRG